MFNNFKDNIYIFLCQGVFYILSAINTTEPLDNLYRYFIFCFLPRKRICWRFENLSAQAQSVFSRRCYALVLCNFAFFRVYYHYISLPECCECCSLAQRAFLRVFHNKLAVPAGFFLCHFFITLFQFLFPFLF